jgi:hypothetical protein
MSRGGGSIDKKSRMASSNNGNPDRYQSLQEQSQHVYTNNQVNKGDNVFKMNSTAYKSSYPGRHHQHYEELLLPEAATGVSIGQHQQNSAAKRRNSRGNPSLHNSGKTAIESSH